MVLKNQDIIVQQPSAKAVVEEVFKITAANGDYEVISKQREGITYKGFATLPNNLGEMYKNAADTYGDSEFLVYKSERYSFLEIYQLAMVFRDVLHNDYQIKKADKVVIAMRNYPEWIIAFMGITMLGAVAVPINVWLSHDELLHAIKHSHAVMVITDDKRYNIFGRDLARLNLPVLNARPAQNQPKNRCFMSNIKYRKNKDIALDDGAINSVSLNDLATIFYTSGSTGLPKGAVSNHESILTALNTWCMLGVAAGIASSQDIKETGDTPASPVALMTVPLFHVTGCHTLFLLSLLIGRKVIMMPYWDPKLALELIEKERVSYFNGVPTMSMELMDHPDKANYDLSSLLDICAGGAARAPEHVRKISLAFEQGNPSCGYGLTETNALGAVNGPVEYLSKPESAGLPTPPIVDLKIIDANNNALENGQMGEIVIKTIANIVGYWQDQKATEAAFVDGYFKTGDFGFLDKDGIIHIVDRIKDIIIRGGENISCWEVESVIYTFPHTIETAVFSIPDHRLGESVGAVVYVKSTEEVDEKNLQDYLVERIAQFKVPSKIWFVEDKLPRLGSGKIDKRSLKNQYQALI